MTNWTELLQALASAATAIGVFFAGWQLLMAKRQATTEFEDTLAREYREIALRLPVAALLGERLSTDQHERSLDAFYRYIDLTNEQIYLRINSRVTPAAWRNWAAGIRINLARPAFAEACEEIKLRAPDSFEELRRLEAELFRTDPRSWRRTRRSAFPAKVPSTQLSQPMRASGRSA